MHKLKILRLRNIFTSIGVFMFLILIVNQADAVEIEKTTQEIRGGTEVLGHNGIVEINGCTGWILNERVIVTAAHCLEKKSGSSSMIISYFRPNSGKEELWNGIVRWERHPDWKGEFSIVDYYDNDFAIHDIAYLYNSLQTSVFFKIVVA